MFYSNKRQICLEIFCKYLSQGQVSRERGFSIDLISKNITVSSDIFVPFQRRKPIFQGRFIFVDIPSGK